MADDVRPLDAQRVEDAGHVPDDRREPVVGNGVGLAAPATAAHIRHDRAKALLDQGRHLLAPEVAGVGEAVQQDDRRARTFVADVELEPVGLDQLGQAGTHLRINPDGAGEFGRARGHAQAGRAGRVDVGDDA